VLLSRSRWWFGFLLLIALGPVPASADAALRPALKAGAEVVDDVWLARLSRRLSRLVPVVMASLAAARRARDPKLIRCFDRTVSALHGTGRQLRYHAERWENEASASERKRHANALRLLSARVDELAHMPELCFTDGVRMQPGETYVEVETEQN
jgi:hypothetical protein